MPLFGEQADRQGLLARDALSPGGGAGAATGRGCADGVGGRRARRELSARRHPLPLHDPGARARAVPADRLPAARPTPATASTSPARRRCCSGSPACPRVWSAALPPACARTAATASATSTRTTGSRSTSPGTAGCRSTPRRPTPRRRSRAGSTCWHLRPVTEAGPAPRWLAALALVLAAGWSVRRRMRRRPPRLGDLLVGVARGTGARVSAASTLGELRTELERTVGPRTAALAAEAERARFAPDPPVPPRRPGCGSPSRSWPTPARGAPRASTRAGVPRPMPDRPRTPPSAHPARTTRPDRVGALGLQRRYLAQPSSGDRLRRRARARAARARSTASGVVSIMFAWSSWRVGGGMPGNLPHRQLSGHTPSPRVFVCARHAAAGRPPPSPAAVRRTHRQSEGTRGRAVLVGARAARRRSDRVRQRLRRPRVRRHRHRALRRRRAAPCANTTRRAVRRAARPPARGQARSAPRCPRCARARSRRSASRPRASAGCWRRGTSRCGR